MAKITAKKREERSTITVRTKDKSLQGGPSKWWALDTQEARANALVSTASFLKEQLQYRYRQASVHSRLYSNQPLYGVAGTSFTKMSNNNQLPVDRPTMNVVQSCVDTLVSRITQSRPRPVFLTDNGNYKQRRLGKQLNEFTAGEFYHTDAYTMGELILRDAAVLGTGCIKVYTDQSNRNAIERVLLTELLFDTDDALYGNPRQLYQLKLVDRDVLASMFPGKVSMVDKAENAYPEQADDSKSVADQVMVVEGWRLPSGPDSKDGRHIISCVGVNGSLLDDPWEKESFPFVFLHYSPRLLGPWGQSLAEQLMGTQVEINKLLMTITKSINLVGVPRIFVEEGSKVVASHFTNEIGAIIKYRGVKPQYEVAPCIPQEIYGQLQRLVEYAYQQSGVSALAATSKKPMGLDSGAALREYDDLQTDRFAALNERYDNFFVDLSYKLIDNAKDVAIETGSYSTVYPSKNGTKEIDLPAADMLDDSFIIQCFKSSALPRDPAGRLQKITEMMQAGMISIQEGRRLLDYPDLEQNEKLANSGEERILQILDQIVEDGEYTPPDPFMDLQLALTLSVQYYNLYVSAKLEEDKADMLRSFNAQVQAMLQAAQPPAPAMNPPQAVPAPLPVSPMLPQAA